MAAPEFTLNQYEWTKHQSDDAFKDSLRNDYRYSNNEKQPATPLPEGQALTDKRLASYAIAKASERRSAFQDLLRNLIVMMINISLFFAHWKIAKFAVQTRAETTNQTK